LGFQTSQTFPTSSGRTFNVGLPGSQPAGQTLYRSLSAAAMAASKDMGLGGRAQNGYLFWGLIKQPGREKDPVAALDRAWERYEARAKGILASSLADETKAKVLSTVRKHAAALGDLQGQVA